VREAEQQNGCEREARREQMMMERAVALLE
jgi:hypothetical protein